jgi:membrane protein
MRASSPHRTGIIEVGKRSIRKFFEHPMSTYAAALAYRGLFGLFPFVLILVVLAGALGLADFLKGAIDQASAETSQHVPEQLEQIQPL